MKAWPTLAADLRDGQRVLVVTREGRVWLAVNRARRRRYHPATVEAVLRRGLATVAPLLLNENLGWLTPTEGA